MHVEGPTEKQFVELTLAPHLCGRGFASVHARRLGPEKNPHKKGGIRPWQKVQRMILDVMKRDWGSYAATMVDYNGLPQSDSWAGPNENNRPTATARQRVEGIEIAMANSVARSLGRKDAAKRFIPFVVLHEFEALLLSDCEAVARSIAPESHQVAGLTKRLESIVKQAGGSPEDINGNLSTSPARQLRRVDLTTSRQHPAD